MNTLNPPQKPAAVRRAGGHLFLLAGFHLSYRHRTMRAVVCALWVLTTASCAHAAASLTLLTRLPGDNGNYNTNGVSGDGSVVVGTSGGYYGQYEPGYDGGGGSIIDSSAIQIVTELPGVNYRANGKIIIVAVPPPLAIIADGANVVLTWPVADTGFTTTGYRLESTTSLVPPVAWQTNSTAPIVIGGQASSSVPFPVHNSFSGSHNENEL